MLQNVVWWSGCVSWYCGIVAYKFCFLLNLNIIYMCFWHFLHKKNSIFINYFVLVSSGVWVCRLRVRLVIFFSISTYFIRHCWCKEYILQFVNNIIMNFMRFAERKFNFLSLTSANKHIFFVNTHTVITATNYKYNTRLQTKTTRCC